MKHTRFVIYQPSGMTGWRWKSQTKNGRVVARSASTYSTKSHALRSAADFVRDVQENAVDVGVASLERE